MPSPTAWTYEPLAVTTEVTPTLLCFPTPQAFLERYWVKDGEAGLVIPGAQGLAPGEHVELELVFLEPSMRFRTRGVIRWRRREHPTAVGFAFPVEERATLDVILNFVHGTSLRGVAQRKHRVPAALNVRCIANGQVFVARTTNLSATGMFVAAQSPPASGVLVSMRLYRPDRPDRCGPIELDGVVVWSRSGGLIPGFGVRFLSRSTGNGQELASVLRFLERDLATRRRYGATG